MARSLNFSNTITGIVIFMLFTRFASTGTIKLFGTGTGHSYRLTSTVTLNEPAERKGKDVGYQIQGDVKIGIVWEKEEDKNEKLIEVEIKSPKLLIKSRKAPIPEGFDVHKSQLDITKSYPYLINWRNGQVLNLYLDEREDVSVANLKKGIASLFQFQVLDVQTIETDASGTCQVTYKTIDSVSFSKTKTDCLLPMEYPTRKNSDPVLSVNGTSSRTSTYKLSRDLSVIESLTAYEHHKFELMIKKGAGGSVIATQHLTLTEEVVKVNRLKSSNLEAALKEFEKEKKLNLSKRSLLPEKLKPNCDKEDCPSLAKLLKENRKHLTDANLGTLKSANAFVKLLSVARMSTKDDLIKAFRGTKNREILAQLCNLAGAIQLPESHEVIMKSINFDAEEDFDRSERYLWALASGYHPHEVVLKDIFKISQRPLSNEKLSETVILTLASMAHRFYRITGNEKNPILAVIRESIVGELNICKEEPCKVKYLRALKNLKCPKTIPVLIEHSLKGKRRASVEAMKALGSFQPEQWTPEVIDAAQRIFFQAGRRYDSSSRTLALDILLESKPHREMLQELILYRLHHDPMFEVKQYLVQRIRSMSEKCPRFAEMVESIMNEFKDSFNNYNVIAQRGLTTSFSREFGNNEHFNGSLRTVLETSSGLLKRGIVDVVIESSGKTTSLFTLGLFAAGLSSFVATEQEKAAQNEIDEEEEVATAGMELSVLGSQIRPFVFFSGQGELMGHVWSGTASEKTPAFQALILVIDHLEHIPLQNGLLAEIEVLGAVSFDLSGQVQISLWNRNAHSLVEKNAGISLQGRVRVDTSFVKSKVEFNVANEVRLDLQSDLNFYSGTSLCMQLSQPEVVTKHNIHKIESIPGGKHRLRKSTYTQFKIPGKTYALNKKNNEMCSSIFS